MSTTIPSGLRLTVSPNYAYNIDYTADPVKAHFTVNLHLDGAHILSIDTGEQVMDEVMSNEDFVAAEWMRSWLESWGLVVPDGITAIWGPHK